MKTIKHPRLLFKSFIGSALLFSTACRMQNPQPPDYTYKRGVNISHWLSQNYGERTYAAPWFQEEDVTWIANQGFDHIRIPVDYKRWKGQDGELLEEALIPFERACEWAVLHGLGVILDMHYLPGASFTQVQNELYTDETLIQISADFWRKIAERYASAGPWLRFELINEPVAKQNHHLNALLKRLLEAVRPSNPTRVVYFTSNMWGKFENVYDLELPDDPNVALTLHFYEPFPFTHQRTSWTPLKPSMPQVEFPGIVPDLQALLPQGHGWLSLTGKRIDAETSVDPKFQRLAEWVDKQSPDLEIHIGEFGVFNAAPPDSIQNYITAVVSAAERHGFSWAVWDYRGGFAVRHENGQPSRVMKGIQEAIAP